MPASEQPRPTLREEPTRVSCRELMTAFLNKPSVGNQRLVLDAMVAHRAAFLAEPEPEAEPETSARRLVPRSA